MNIKLNKKAKTATIGVNLDELWWLYDKTKSAMIYQAIEALEEKGGEDLSGHDKLVLDLLSISR